MGTGKAFHRVWPAVEKVLDSRPRKNIYLSLCSADIVIMSAARVSQRYMQVGCFFRILKDVVDILK